MRTLLAVSVVLAGLWAAAGCQRQACMVKDPPAPYFGPRLAMASGVPPSQPVRPPSEPVAPAGGPGRASWSQAGWDPGGPERSWQFIVIHHSATATGSADSFDRMHRAKGWDELGYHFVVGNGTGSGNGEVEVGGRWTRQKHGAHCKVTGHPEYNDIGVGICLVGDFNQTRPTEGQMAGLARLVRYLMARYHIPRDRIYGHSQLKPTDCPGRHFDYGDLFRRL